MFTGKFSLFCYPFHRRFPEGRPDCFWAINPWSTDYGEMSMPIPLPVVPFDYSDVVLDTINLLSLRGR